MSSATVQTAAGIVLYRRSEGVTRWLLLRNARHGTWGFAKGRTEGDEDAERTAFREVEEETGLERVELLEGFREEIVYPIRVGERTVSKSVVYFLGEVRSEEIRRSAEHDGVLWATEGKARSLLRHEDLRRILDRAVARVLPGELPDPSPPLD